VFISGCVGSSNDNAIGRDGYDGSPMLGPNIARAAIGVGANLLIGVGAVVGAVVTKDVPDGALVTGARRRSDDGCRPSVEGIPIVRTVCITNMYLGPISESVIILVKRWDCGHNGRVIQC
jgi:hypothetical protein